jgi:hypothetical protein
MIGKIERKLIAKSIMNENEQKKRHLAILDALQQGLGVFRSFALGNGDINKFILEHPDFEFLFRKVYYHRPSQGSYSQIDNNFYMDVFPEKPKSNGVYVVETQLSVSPTYIIYENENYTFIQNISELKNLLRTFNREEKINEITNDLLS